MFTTKYILTAFSFLAATMAAPADVEGRKPLAPPTITVCSGSISPPNGCVVVPVVSDSCINLTGGLSFLNKEISWAQVPGGFVCTFFEDFGCLNGGVNAHDVAILTGGTWNMANVHGIASSQNFNDLTSSISCSPV